MSSQTKAQTSMTGPKSGLRSTAGAPTWTFTIQSTRMAACFLWQIPLTQGPDLRGSASPLPEQSGIQRIYSTPISARPGHWSVAQGPACPLPIPSHLLAWWLDSSLTVSRLICSFTILPGEKILTGFTREEKTALNPCGPGRHLPL